MGTWHARRGRNIQYCQRELMFTDQQQISWAVENTGLLLCSPLIFLLTEYTERVELKMEEAAATGRNIWGKDEGLENSLAQEKLKGNMGLQKIAIGLDSVGSPFCQSNKPKPRLWKDPFDVNSVT